MSSGPSPSPDTVSYQLRHWSRTDPDTLAFIFRSADPRLPRLTLTRGEVYTYATRYAAVLRRKGIRRGDIVCNTLRNSPERLITDLGIMAAGAVAMNGVIMLADGSDFLGCLHRSGCVALVMDRTQTALQEKFALSPAAEDDVINCAEAPALTLLLKVNLEVSEDGRKPFLEELKRRKDGGKKEEEEEYMADVAPSDNAVIWTTSGSTGFCKMVSRTHAAFLRIGASLGIDIHQGDVFHNDRPFGWIGGASTIYCLKGITRVTTDQSAAAPADPASFLWEAIHEERCTVANIVPSTICSLLARPELWENKHRLHTLLTGK